MKPCSGSNVVAFMCLVVCRLSLNSQGRCSFNYTTAHSGRQNNESIEMPERKLGSNWGPGLGERLQLRDINAPLNSAISTSLEVNHRVEQWLTETECLCTASLAIAGHVHRLVLLISSTSRLRVLPLKFLIMHLRQPLQSSQ